MSAAIDDFLAMLAAERGAAANTLAAYRRDLEGAEDAIGGLAEASPELLQSLGNVWSGLAPSSLARKASALRQFYGFLVDEGIRKDDPSPALPRPATRRSLPKILSHDEVNALFARAELEAERQGIPRVVDALRAATPAGTMIFSDMTQFAYVAKEIWDMDAPGHWHHPTGFGTLGYALPAAIGGAVARPGLPTMAIAGDYGFQYTLPELGTAAELGQCLPIILWDNGKLKEIEDSMIGAQIAPNAVIARNPDFGLLAEAYGCAYDAPVDLAAMREAVTRAFAHQGPSLIHIRDTIA